MNPTGSRWRIPSRWGRSGMVDSLFENHGDIGDGVFEVGDTGKAIGHLAEDAWHKIF